MRTLKRFKTSGSFWFLFAILLVFILGVADYISGYEISFAFFYLAPVSIAAWYSDKRHAIFVSLLAALVWHEANTMSGEAFLYWFIPYWNVATRLGFFVVTTLLLSRVKSSLENEREISRVDHLTGVFNSRAFEDVASTELQRTSRSAKPITIAYLDLDDFKEVNDRYGHSEGDLVLRVVAKTVLLNIRRSDTIARIGGDEFVILLPETGGDGAKVVMEKLQKLLNSEMLQNNWNVGFSFGAVTFVSYPETVRHMVETADLAMYSAKRNGKNKIEYVIIGEKQNAGNQLQIVQ